MWNERESGEWKQDLVTQKCPPNTTRITPSPNRKFLCALRPPQHIYRLRWSKALVPSPSRFPPPRRLSLQAIASSRGMMDNGGASIKIRPEQYLSEWDALTFGPVGRRAVGRGRALCDAPLDRGMHGVLDFANRVLHSKCNRPCFFGCTSNQKRRRCNVRRLNCTPPLPGGWFGINPFRGSCAVISDYGVRNY